jgi:hypothetical protein
MVRRVVKWACRALDVMAVRRSYIIEVNPTRSNASDKIIFTVNDPFPSPVYNEDNVMLASDCTKAAPTHTSCELSGIGGLTAPLVIDGCV